MIQAFRTFRPFRTSLRSLMALVFVVGGVVGWVVYAAKLQRDVVRAVVKNGGQALYSWQLTRVAGPDGQDWKPIVNAQPAGPGWLVRQLGPDFFGAVETVHLGPRRCDDVLPLVARLPTVEWLSVDPRGALSSAGLAHVRTMRALRQLSIPGARIRDLTPLRGQIGLEFIDISDTAVDDDSLAALTDLANLKMIDLRRTPVGNAGLGHLRGLPRLSHLCLSGTHVTDDGILSLSTLRRLARLDMEQTAITDVGLGRLSRIPTLENLDLGGTKITDEGLKHLVNLKNLRSVSLRRTGVTSEGVTELRKARPDLVVTPP